MLRLSARFPKVEGRVRQARFEWSNGVVAETPMYGRWLAFPHDADHYVIDSHVKPPYGFWPLVGRQAPFRNFTLVEGRWPKDRVEWFERVKRKHRDEMVQAEAIGVVRPLAHGRLDLDRDWNSIRRALTRAYAITGPSVYAAVTKQDLIEMIDFHRELEAVWERVPVGGELVLHWPPDRPPETSSAC